MSEFLIIIKPEQNLIRIQTFKDIKRRIPVYILSKSSLLFYPNIDIKKLISNQISAETIRSIKQENIYITYNCDAILSQKNNKEELFIANKEYLKLSEPIVYCLINSLNQIFLHFIYEKIALMIGEQPSAKVIKLNNRIVNNNNNFPQNVNVINNTNMSTNNNDYQNLNKINDIQTQSQNLISEKKKKNVNNILYAIILFYANEKEIKKLITTTNILRVTFKKYIF